MKISEIKPNPNNPRRIYHEKLEKLMKSIRDFPEMLKLRPIVVDESGVILGGNMRYLALKKIGAKEVEVIVARGLSEEQKREFIIKDNNEFGEWDFDMLSGWDEKTLEDWGVDYDILGKCFDIKAKEDEIPEVPTKTNIKTGDIFKLGDHILICGDSTNENIFRNIEADMVFADPPFDMEFEILKKCFLNTKNIGKVQFWMGGDRQITKLASEFFDIFSHYFVFDFVTPLMTNRYRPMQRHNLIAQFKNVSIKNFKDSFTTIVRVGTTRTSPEHEIFSMGKKVELPGTFIRYFCRNSVLDPFGGYGSTMIAAEQLHKKCTMVEINPNYCQLIIDRWETLTGKTASKITGDSIA